MVKCLCSKTNNKTTRRPNWGSCACAHGVKSNITTFHYVSGAGLSSGGVARSGFAFDGDDFKTGQYPYELRVSNNFNSTRIGSVYTGVISVENEERSPFGAGWMLSGLYKLAFNLDSSITLVSPAGHMITYRPGVIANSYTAPANDYAAHS